MSEDKDFVLTRTLDERIEDLNLKPPILEDPPHYQAIAHLKAGGADPLQISTLLGINIEEVKKVAGLRKIKDLCFEIQKRYANRDFQNLFKDILPDAVEVVRGLMLNENTKEGTRLSAAVAIMDRALGKPSQNVEIGSSMIRDLFTALDKHESQRINKAIQIEAKPVNNEVVEGEFKEMNTEAVKPVQENSIDSWAKENLK